MQLASETYPEWPAPYHSESCVCDRCLALDLNGGGWGFWRCWGYTSLDDYVRDVDVWHLSDTLQAERANFTNAVEGDAEVDDDDAARLGEPLLGSALIPLLVTPR